MFSVDLSLALLSRPLLFHDSGDDRLVEATFSQALRQRDLVLVFVPEGDVFAEHVPEAPCEVGDDDSQDDQPQDLEDVEDGVLLGDVLLLLALRILLRNLAEPLDVDELHESGKHAQLKELSRQPVAR